MKPESKKVLTTLLVIVWIVGIYILTRLFAYKDHISTLSFEGMLAGAILIAIYQQNLLNDWVYKNRYLLNSIGLGLGCLLIGFLDSLVLNIHRHLIFHVAFSFAAGFMFGLVLFLIDSQTVRKRKKGNPVPDKVRYLMSCKASELKLERPITPGIALLLEDRLLFQPTGSARREVLFSDIRQMGIGRTFGFPQRLVLYLNNEQDVTFHVSMPCFWRKKIAAALSNRNL